MCASSVACTPHERGATRPEIDASVTIDAGIGQVDDAGSGGFRKRAFPDAMAALQSVLEHGKPRVLAFGEMHAPRGATVRSATARFQADLLPLLAPHASALVVEAWQPAGCGAKVEAAVASTNRDITKQQASENPNEYLALANAAKARGLVPLPLRPTCEETAKVADAGAADVTTLLETVTQVAERTLKSALARTPERLILFYGGALHNDLEPSPARASWSFGPALDAESGGAYVEIDLVVPEFVQDTEVWNALPWRPAYDLTKDGDSVQLLSRGNRRFVLVFARSPLAPDAGRE